MALTRLSDLKGGVITSKNCDNNLRTVQVVQEQCTEVCAVPATVDGMQVNLANINALGDRVYEGTFSNRTGAPVNVIIAATKFAAQGAYQNWMPPISVPSAQDFLLFVQTDVPSPNILEANGGTLRSLAHSIGNMPRVLEQIETQTSAPSRPSVRSFNYDPNTLDSCTGRVARALCDACPDNNTPGTLSNNWLGPWGVGKMSGVIITIPAQTEDTQETYIRLTFGAIEQNAILSEAGCF